MMGSVTTENGPHPTALAGTPATDAERRDPHPAPAWAWPALIALLVLTGVSYLTNLTASHWANGFYAAAVQAGSVSWKAFFFGSFDGSNAITVDKPPAALWPMALSVRLLGLSSFALLLPQVLMGVATVAVTYATVRRHFGHGAALLAGAVLAVTPVAVLIFRYDNPDALLTLFMALAIWATLRAVESGSIRWIALAGVFVGLGFLTKALQVVLVVPAVAVVWLLCADTSWRRRVLGGLASAGAFLASAGWWVAIVSLLPASMRPYAGSSQTNSFLELAFGYNGLGRLSGSGEAAGNPGTASGEPVDTGAGVLRMLHTQNAGQISWLLPAALVFLLVGLWFLRRVPRSDVRRATYLAMGGWLGVALVVLSLMQGIFHRYYTVAMAPPIAALVGMGAAEAWRRRETVLGRLLLGGVVAVTAGFSFVLLSQTSAYGGLLRLGVLGVGVASAALLLLGRRLSGRAAALVATTAIVASLAGPIAYSATTIGTAHNGSTIGAGPPGVGGVEVTPANEAGSQAQGQPGDTSSPTPAVLAALTQDAVAYRWVAATSSSSKAAGLQLSSQHPVLMIGGFGGSDPFPTLAQFQGFVAHHEIHYYLTGGEGQDVAPTAQKIKAWATANFQAVTIGGQTLYDLTRPTGGTSAS
jgi:4-amino-4-deoxy-L-arabinose transferase-like glycosyltransferase